MPETPCPAAWCKKRKSMEFDSNSLIANGALTSKAVIPIHGLLSLDSILREIITELLIPDSGGFEASLQLEKNSRGTSFLKQLQAE